MEERRHEQRGGLLDHASQGHTAFSAKGLTKLPSGLGGECVENFLEDFALEDQIGGCEMEIEAGATNSRPAFGGAFADSRVDKRDM